MERRQFFGWVSKLSLAVGLGYLAGNANEIDDRYEPAMLSRAPGDMRVRMNGRACHDYRMISSDRSMIFDRNIFNG